jgi:AbrB family looped-hinge helix DNA binding protein
MSGAHQIVVGDRGRLVVPAEVRDRAGIHDGTPMILLETPTGLVLLTRDQLKSRVRAELEGLDLVGELLAERRVAATIEDDT